MDYFGQFQTDFVQLWSNVGHIWPFLDRKFALRLFQNTETAFRACFFVMEITFSMEKFPHSAVGFRSKDQAASRARIFSWSAGGGQAVLHGAWLASTNRNAVIGTNNFAAHLQNKNSCNSNS